MILRQRLIQPAQYLKGQRIRLALSNTYWPMLWPTNQGGMLTLHTDGASLSLPTPSEYKTCNATTRVCHLDNKQPGQAKMTIQRDLEVSRHDWRVSTQVEATISSTAEEFSSMITLTVKQDDMEEGLAQSSISPPNIFFLNKHLPTFKLIGDYLLGAGSPP